MSLSCLLGLLIVVLPFHRRITGSLRLKTKHAGHTHTQPFNGHLSGTTQVSQYQKGKTNLDFTEATDIEWQ